MFNKSGPYMQTRGSWESSLCPLGPCAKTTDSDSLPQEALTNQEEVLFLILHSRAGLISGGGTRRGSP